jgi:hypothetical protein
MADAMLIVASAASAAHPSARQAWGRLACRLFGTPALVRVPGGDSRQRLCAAGAARTE